MKLIESMEARHLARAAALSALAITGLGLEVAQAAATHVYDLQTTTVGAYSQTGPIGGGLIQNVAVWNLVDATSGASSGAGYLLAPGDEISGTIRFAHIWTPANRGAAAGMPDWFTFQLGNFAGTAYPVADQVFIDYYLAGALVSSSTPVSGGFGNRITSAPDASEVIPAASFDSIKFRIDVADVYDNALGAFGVPTQVSGDYGQLLVFDFAPAAVPEPASWALVLAAMAGFGIARRSKSSD